MNDKTINTVLERFARLDQAKNNMRDPEYLQRIIMEQDEQHNRDVARLVALMDVLEGMCNQYLGDGGGDFEHMCMSAGEGVEQLFFDLGILVENDDATFGIAENWRDILDASDLPKDTGARTFHQRLGMVQWFENRTLVEENAALRIRIAELEAGAETTGLETAREES